ncbi:unnamed protein product [Symbiodinium microadriaticum]|nr:unnamed protein product [Symbiodinium microadriaticum]
MTFLHFVDPWILRFALSALLMLEDQEPKVVCLRRSRSYAGYVPFALNGSSTQVCETMAVQDFEHEADADVTAPAAVALAHIEEPRPQTQDEPLHATRSVMSRATTPLPIELEVVLFNAPASSLKITSHSDATVVSPRVANSPPERSQEESSNDDGFKAEIDKLHSRIRICNLDAAVTQSSLVEAVDHLGFAGQYELCNFCPSSTGDGMGHAFLNFRSAASAYKFQVKWHGQATLKSLSREKSKPQPKNVAEVHPSAPGPRQNAEVVRPDVSAKLDSSVCNCEPLEENSQPALLSTGTKPDSTKAATNPGRIFELQVATHEGVVYI